MNRITECRLIIILISLTFYISSCALSSEERAIVSARTLVSEYLKALSDYFQAKAEERKMHEEALKTTPGLLANIYDLERALLFKRAGKKELMEKTLEEAGEEGLIAFKRLRGDIPEKLIGKILEERRKEYEKEKRPGAMSFIDVARKAIVDVEKREEEIVMKSEPITIPLEKPPLFGELMH